MKKFSLLLCLFITGCANYAVPLCDDSNRRDLANLEGSFSTVYPSITNVEFRTEHDEMVISRLSRGKYLLESHDSSSRANVCEVSGHLYVEDHTAFGVSLPTHGYVAFQITPNGDNSFDFTGLGIDAKVLNSQHIPYKIIDNQAQADSGPFRTLLVDNAKIPAEQMVELLEPLSIKITLRPEGGRVTFKSKEKARNSADRSPYSAPAARPFPHRG